MATQLTATATQLIVRHPLVFGTFGNLMKASLLEKRHRAKVVKKPSLQAAVASPALP